MIRLTLIWFGLGLIGAIRASFENDLEMSEGLSFIGGGACTLFVVVTSLDIVDRLKAKDWRMPHLTRGRIKLR